MKFCHVFASILVLFLYSFSPFWFPFYGLKKLKIFSAFFVPILCLFYSVRVLYIIASENYTNDTIALFYSVGKFLYYFTRYRVKKLFFCVRFHTICYVFCMKCHWKLSYFGLVLVSFYSVGVLSNYCPFIAFLLPFL